MIKQLEKQGYVIIPNALSEEMISRLNNVINTKWPKKNVDTRNCVVEDDAFLDLLEWKATFPLVREALGSNNIQLLTSHLIIRSNLESMSLHRDGGATQWDIKGKLPRLMIKVGYALSDQNEETGATVVIPGSHLWEDDIPLGDNLDREDLIPINLKTGDAFAFDQRLWHGAGPNWQGIRKTIFYGYGYRWLRPIDYDKAPDDVLKHCTSTQKQLLGYAAEKTPQYWLPGETLELE